MKRILTALALTLASSAGAVTVGSYETGADEFYRGPGSYMEMGGVTVVTGQDGSLLLSASQLLGALLSGGLTLENTGADPVQAITGTLRQLGNGAGYIALYEVNGNTTPIDADVGSFMILTVADGSATLYRANRSQPSGEIPLPAGGLLLLTGLGGLVALRRR